MNFTYFKVDDIFPKPKKKITKFSSVPSSKGSIPFVSSSSYNNGVVAYTNEKSFEGPCITVSTNGKCFDCFYHDGKIAISSDVELLTNDSLNKYVALYICTLLNSESFKWCYGRKPKNDKVFKTRIKLPTNKFDKPDYEYMEKYIKRITNDKKYSFGTLKNVVLTDNNKIFKPKIWKNDDCVKIFRFGDLIEPNEIYKSTAYAKIDLETSDHKQSGYIQFVSRTEDNNGVDCYAKKEKGFKIELKNCLTIGDTTATIFYQDDDFITGDHIVVCRPSWLNKYTGLYIKTVLDKEKYRYSYGRAFKKDTIMNTLIALPASSDGKPDWEYMEKYISSLPFADRI